MKKSFLIFTSFVLCFLIPAESSGRKKRRVAKRKWSLSLANGYSFYKLKSKSSSGDPLKSVIHPEGQMNLFFSALEVSRNFGSYEIGAKIQNNDLNFISPFFTWNLSRNHSRSSIVPGLTLGIVPFHLSGVWLRFSLGLSLNRYISFSPFAGVYAWYKVKGNPPGSLSYEKTNVHFNAGLKINLFI